LLTIPLKKQEHFIASEYMQFHEVRLLRLLSVASQLHYVFLSSITSWMNWLKCYKVSVLGIVRKDVFYSRFLYHLF